MVKIMGDILTCDDRALLLAVRTQVLFNTSIRENIAYGKKDASDVEVMSAARLAALGPFIESLPEGLHTLVGEVRIAIDFVEWQLQHQCIIQDVYCSTSQCENNMCLVLTVFIEINVSFSK